MLLASGRDMARCTTCEYKGPAPESDDSEELEAEAVGASA